MERSHLQNFIPFTYELNNGYIPDHGFGIYATSTVRAERILEE